MLVVRLALAEVLEDSEHRRDLPCGDDLLGAASKESAQQSDEGGDVAAALPQGRGEQGRENGAVHVGQAGGKGVQLEQLREDLKDEGRELRNVLREDGLEGREERRLESREGRRLGGGDKAAGAKSANHTRVRVSPGETCTHRTRAEMLSKVKWLNFGFEGFLLISPRIATRCCRIAEYFEASD